MDTHREIVLMAVGHGVRTIVQKPFAPDWQACVDMVDAADKAGVPSPCTRTSATRPHDGREPGAGLRRDRRAELGPHLLPDLLDIYRNQPYFHAEKRFIILDVGVHVLDLARVFLGEVKHVSCETQRRNARNLAEDTATMMLRHESGAVSVVECTYEAKQIPDPSPDAADHRGTARLHQAARGLPDGGHLRW